MNEMQIIPVGGEPPPLDLVPARDERRPAKGRKGTGKRFQVINTFADFTLAGLDRAEVAVWLLLWRDTRPDGLARTAQTDLARRAGCSTRTVRRALKSLERAGLVVVAYQGGLNRGLSVYRVN